MKKILNNRILKIIFALKNRENYVEKYLKNIIDDPAELRFVNFIRK